MSYINHQYSFGTLNDMPLSLKIHLYEAEVLHDFLVRIIENEVYKMAWTKENRNFYGVKEFYKEAPVRFKEIYPIAEIQKAVDKTLANYRARNFQSTVISKKKRTVTKQLTIRLKFSLWLLLNESLNRNCHDGLAQFYMQVDKLVLNTMPQLFPITPITNPQNNL